MENGKGVQETEQNPEYKWEETGDEDSELIFPLAGLVSTIRD